jgi:hypothetical protein
MDNCGPNAGIPLSIADIATTFNVVLPRGARPIFQSTSIDPGATVSSRPR